MEVAPAIVLVALIASAMFLICWSLLFRYKRRELEHQERLAPAAPAQARAPWTPRLYLLRGLIWLFSGIALTVFLLAVSVTQRPLSLEDRVREVWHDTSPHGGPPLGLALIGLVPIGVGAAYLIFYRKQG